MDVLTTRAFEEQYLQRARAALDAQGGIDSVESVRLDQGKDGGGALVGWWLPPEVASPHLVLPNPWEAPEAVATYEEYAWGLTASLLRDLGPLLDSIHGERPAVYWETLLLPWLLGLTTAVLDRRLYLITAAELAPNRIFVGGEQPRTPTTMLDFALSLQTEPGNAALMTAMAPALGLRVDELDPAAGTPHTPQLSHRAAPSLAGFLRNPRAAATSATSLLTRLGLGGQARRQVALLHWNYAFAPLDAARLCASSRDVRVTPRRRRGPLSPPTATHPGRASLAQISAGDDCGQLIAELLPRLMPRSLLEGFAEVEAESRRHHGDPAHLIAGNYWVDEVDNDYIGRCRASGRSVVFVQHGGRYMQIAVNQLERCERLPGTLFAGWGAREPGVEPVPIPRLERLRDSHAGGDQVVLVDWTNPAVPYVVQFASIPMGSQEYDIRDRLGRFVESVRAARGHLVLKPFPTFTAEHPSHPSLDSLSTDGPVRSVWATDWMRHARVAVISYPDTALIEAMLIGVPIIGLWSRELWRMRPDAEPFFDELFELGVFHDDPIAAASKLDDIYDRAPDWWSRAEIQDARRRFLERFASGGDWRARWKELLGRLKADG